MKPINKTPDHLRCGGSQSSCPSLHEIEGDRYLIVGKVAEWEASEAGAAWGANEAPITIGKEHFAEVLAEAIADEREASSRSLNEVAQSVAGMVVEWVDGGLELGTDWRGGLSDIIEKRLARLAIRSRSQSDILPLGKGGYLVQTDVQQGETLSGHPDLASKLLTLAAQRSTKTSFGWSHPDCETLQEAARILKGDPPARADDGRADAVLSQQVQALSGHLDFEARAREIAGQLSYPLDDNWRDKPFLRLLVDEAATRNHALIAAALREVSELGAPSHLGMKARLALLNAAEAEYERNLGPLTPAEVKSHIAELMSRKTEHVNEIERLAKALIRARQELDAAGNQIRADGKPHHADDIVITIEVIDEVLSQVGIASAPRQSEEPHRGNARAEEAALADALNCRDAYGVVVSRLIEWFGDPANGLFDKEDYQAIMMDAGLMDREDYHVLLRRARRLFDLPLRQIEEPQSGDTAAHLASGSPDTAKMPPYEYQKEDNRSFAVSYAEPKILPKPIIPETGH